MAQTNVSNGILSIIAAFSNGLDVLKKLRRNTPKKKKTSKWTNISRKQQTDNDEEGKQALRLSRSLRRGVDDIGREYQARSMRCDGERYAVGDAKAQSSLAEILIKFNTGLVSIITSFLGREDDGKKDRRRARLADLDYRSLTDLSEQSREQSLAVLRQLYQRVVLASCRSSLPDPQKPPSHNHNPRRRAKKRPTARHPTLARVVIENSSIPSQIALVRPSESNNSSYKKPRSRSQSQTPTPQKSALSLAPSNLSIPPPPYFPSDPLPQPFQSSQGDLSNLSPNLNSKPPRHATSSASLLKPPKRHPNQNPTPASTPIPISKPRPPTHYSLATTSSTRTTSTKLGEIPMRKWAVPWDFEAAEEANRRALEAGWPVVCDVVELGGGGLKRERGRWGRWFGRGKKVGG